MAVKLVERKQGVNLMTRSLFERILQGQASEQRVILCTMYIVDNVKFSQAAISNGLARRWPFLAHEHQLVTLGQ
jgi:hypothetical protein